MMMKITLVMMVALAFAVVAMPIHAVHADAPATPTAATTAPAPKIPFTISKETTGITEPLRPDGTPDYVKSLNDKYGKDVTPENNGFVVWMQVVGSKVLADVARAQILALSGAKPPAGGEGVDGSLVYTGPPAPGLAMSRWNSMQSRLWRAQEFPEYAAFLESQAKALALATEASQKPRWWVPAVSSNGTLARIPNPNVHLFTVASALCARATLRAGQGDFDGFLSDVMTAKRLARLTMDWSEISHMAAEKSDNLADQSIAAVAGAGNLTAEQCAALAKAIDGLQPLPSLVEVMDLYSRWNSLEQISYLAQGQIERALGPLAYSKDEELRAYFEEFGTVERDAVDWNLALKVANTRTDETLAILKRTLMKDEMEGRDAFMRKISEILARPHDDMRRKDGETKEAYSARVSEAISLGIDPWRHERLRRELVLITEMSRSIVAAAQYRAAKGHWPEKIDDLVPQYLKAVPIDIYSTDEKDEVRLKAGPNGVRVYSIGPNRVDDGGASDPIPDPDDAKPRRDDIVIGVSEK